MHLRKNQSGFTMLELIIVILIIAILVVIGLTLQVSSLGRARDSRRKADLKNIKEALEGYKTDKNSYPLTNPGLSSLQPDYLKTVPTDPGASHPPYSYQSDGSTFTLSATLENEKDSAYPTYTVTNSQ